MPDAAAFRSRKKANRTRGLLLVLLAVACALLTAPAAFLQTEGPPPVFEIELPAVGISPTSRAEVTIASADVSQVLVHVLRPVADNVDYSAIHASVNGQSTAQLSAAAGNRGTAFRNQCSAR